MQPEISGRPSKLAGHASAEVHGIYLLEVGRLLIPLARKTDLRRARRNDGGGVPFGASGTPMSGIFAMV